MIKPQPFTATVISNEYIAKETRKTVFTIGSKFDIQFSTGQFFNIKVPAKNPDEKMVMRAYSIASSSSRLPEFELCVKVVENGKGSGYIDKMKAGDKIKMMGPFGHFGKKSEESKTIMIATGTGIAPMKAVCDELSEEHFEYGALLIFGVSQAEYASYDEYFTEMNEEHENFEYKLYVSRPNKNFTGNIGRVTAWLETQDVSDFENTEVLICGNPAMVKEVKKTLIDDFGIEKGDVVVEAY